MEIKTRNSVMLCPCAILEIAVDALTSMRQTMTRAHTTTMARAKRQHQVAPMPLHATTMQMRRKTTVLASRLTSAVFVVALASLRVLAIVTETL